MPHTKARRFRPHANPHWWQARKTDMSTITPRVGYSETDRLVGLVVRRPPRERKVPGSNPACAGIFSGSSHTSDLNIGTPVATLPGAWRYRVSAGTGRPGVSILWVGEMESWICNFYLRVAARPWDTLAYCWDVKQPTTNKQSEIDSMFGDTEAPYHQPPIHLSLLCQERTLSTACCLN